MARTCVFCGHRPRFLEDFWEVSQRWSSSPEVVGPVVTIMGAPLDLGFCKDCAPKLGRLLHSLYKNGRIPLGPNVTYGDFTYRELSEARDFCKDHVNNIPDPAIKTKVQEWISLSDLLIVELQKRAREEMKAAEARAQEVLFLNNYFTARNAFLGTGPRCTLSSGQELVFSNKVVYMGTEATVSNKKLYIALSRTTCKDTLLSPYSSKEHYAANNFAAALDATITQIPFDNIIYFKETGQIEHLSNINGGMVTVADAFCFGSAGDIKTSVKTIDSRRVSFRYKKADGTVAEISFPYDAYPFLLKVMPEKEFSMINLEAQTNKAALPAQQESKSDSFEEIKKYKELWDLGIITKEEFLAKKKELLNL